MHAEVPQLDPKTWLTMADMGMGDMDMGDMKMGDMEVNTMARAQGMKPMEAKPGMVPQDMSSMSGQATGPHASMSGMDHDKPGTMPDMPTTRKTMGHGMGGKEDMSGMGPQVDMRSMNPSGSLSDPGPRLRNNGRRVLSYADLKTLGPVIDKRPPSRELELRLTGNMRRFIWGIDGKKFSQAEPIRLYYGERLRITLVNDTMMNHPMHLHGMFSELENDEGEALVRKHTINVHPSKKASFLVTADAPGQWAFHCHLLYHMEAGMFRKVVVA